MTLVGLDGRWYRRAGRGRGGALRVVRTDDVPPAGALLSVRVLGVSHEGVWTGESVVHSSRRRGLAAEESLAAFGGRGRLVTVVGQGTEGAVSRARASIGRRWSPVDNCQRFVARVSGVRRSSRDASLAVVAAGCIGALAAVWSK